MKTKRFLFYTGGADSTLLYKMLLDAIKLPDNQHDDLVLVMVCNDTLGSGQTHKLGEIIDRAHNMLRHEDEVTRKRVTILNPHTTFLYGTERVDFWRTDEVSPLEMANGLAMREVVKGVALQEVTLISIIPTLFGFLGQCKNKFYMGMCGSDMAACQVEQLQQLLALQFQIATYMNRHDSLEIELSTCSTTAQGMMSGRPSFPKEWIPTLEFPLMKVNKKEVYLLLEDARIKDFKVDKIEDLLGHYAMKGKMEILFKTAFYHDMLKQHPDITTSLAAFIGTGKLYVGKKLIADKAAFEEHQMQQVIQICGRGLK